MNQEQRPRLGDLAKDIVTGFTGIVVARTEWLNRCVRLTLQPQKLQKDGKTPDTQTFDEEQIKVVKPAHVVPRSLQVETVGEAFQRRRQTGGPHPEPRRGNETPRR
jgi:hypothetical protein